MTAKRCGVHLNPPLSKDRLIASALITILNKSKLTFCQERTNSWLICRNGKNLCQDQALRSRRAFRPRSQRRLTAITAWEDMRVVA